MPQKLKQVSELYGKHEGADIYVVGTGTSMRVLPDSFFDGKIVVGLNMAWKVAPVTYGITIHPDLNIPEYMDGETPHPEISWITGHIKAKKLLSEEQMDYAEKHFFFFDYYGQKNTAPPNEPSTAGRILDWVRTPTQNYLYNWSSISQSGVNLAANLGAKNVILVGCDNSALLSNHHAHGQHTRWKGVSPDHRYQQYYEGLREVRTVLKERNVNVLNLTPFLGLSRDREDFAWLCQENGVAEFMKEEDISDKFIMPKFYYNKFRKRFRKGAKKILNTLRPQQA